MKRYKTPEEYYANVELWQQEQQALRKVLLQTELEETIKWGAPCYTVDGKNLVGVGGFKNFFTLWFFQGALLEDPKKVLVNAQEGTTKALRQWRFTDIKEIDEKLIKAYVHEAIDNQRAGREIKPTRNKPLEIPAELTAALKKNKKAAAQFEEFSKSKKREFAEHISTAKREETKQSRLEKILPMIEQGIGLHDKYRNC